MSHNCPTHQCELVHRVGTSKKTGKPYDFWGCPQRDGNNFCDFTAPGQRVGGNSVVPSQREELTGQVLASMNLKIDRILEGQKLITEMLESIGGRELPKPNPNQTTVPF